MKPTIYTIAEQAGVSIATVSRAFNNSPRISAETRLRVLRVADTLGYRPSASARSLATSTTNTLALILPQTSGPYYSELLRGAESISRSMQYHLLIYSCRDLDTPDDVLGFLPARVDGLLISTLCSTGEYLRRLMAQHYPFVLINSNVLPTPLNTVNPDNVSGAYAMTQHLLHAHGYRDIGFIMGEEKQPHSVERLAGFRRAMEENNVPVNENWIKAGFFDEASGYDRARELLTLTPRPRALFASSDLMAIGAMAAAAELGLRVPQDVAIVGFDDVPTARFVQPPLTTVSVSTFEQGERAVRRLLKLIAEPTLAPEQLLLPSPLVLRSSCGCEPANA